LRGECIGFATNGSVPLVVQLPLNPVELLLLAKPGYRKRIWTKSSAASLQQLDHRKSVVALGTLDSQPRPNTVQEGPGRQPGRASPGKAWSCTSLPPQDDYDPAAPGPPHPVKDITISVGDHNLHAILVAAALGLERSGDRDAAFAGDEAGRVRPVCGLQCQKRPTLGGALHGRLDVQAAHEDLQRQSRFFEIPAQKLEIGAGLL
jgi:hypothetical protein